MESASKNYKQRKQLVVEKTFQIHVIWRFVTAVLLSILGTQILIVGFIHFKAWINPANDNLIYLSGAISETVGFAKVMEVLWLPLTFSALLVSSLVILFALFYSHRIAGPLFNLKRMMQAVGQGKLTSFMQIRKNDEFHDVKNEFNEMVSGLKAKIIQLESEINKIPGMDKKRIENLFQQVQLQIK
jgi:methyl-accepting chemotaxis protein